MTNSDQEMNSENILINDVRAYWTGKCVPQQWYSKKEPLTLPWFNEIANKRYSVYYKYLKEDAEFGWHQNEKVLEIGVGVGTDLVEYVKNGAKGYGIDLGIDQVMLSKLNFKLRGFSYEKILEANAEDIPFEDEYFDLVYSFGVIHHTPNTEKAIQEIYRVLKPDGKAIIMLYAKGWKHYLKRCFIHGLLKGRWMVHGFNWQKVYDEVSEVYGNSPKTGIYNKRSVKKLFNQFKTVSINKKRLGEFFEYKPYGTFMFPSFIEKIFCFLNLESMIGENWLIKAQKKLHVKDGKLMDVLFKHY